MIANLPTEVALKVIYGAAESVSKPAYTQA